MQTELFTIQLEPLTPDEIALNERAIAVANAYNVSEKSLLEVIIEVDRSGFYRKLNFAKLTPYCREVLQLSETIAGYHVTIARKSASVPELAQAVVDGKLSVSTAVQVASVVTKANCENWVDKAESLTKHELEKEVAKVATRPRKAARVKCVGEDRFEIRMEVSAETWALYKRVVDLESQRLGTSATGEQSVAQSFDDYLEKRDPVRKAERSQKAAEEKATYENGKRTAIPAAIRHAVNRRDRGCCRANVDGKNCGSTSHVELHHIVEIAKGGKHEIANIVTLCGFHHRMHHRAFPGKAARV